jgi:signal transduction histidine kinase
MDDKTRLERLERILRFSRELTSSASLESLLYRIVDATVELVGCEMAMVLLLDRSGSELRLKAATTLASQLVDTPVPIEDTIVGEAFSSGQALIVDDVSADPRRCPAIEQQTGFKARSLLALPLEVKDRRIGVLAAANRRKKHALTGDDVETLSLLTVHATVAIENAQLVQDMEEARDLAEALRTAGAVLNRSLDYDQVLDSVLEQMNAVVPFDAANVMLISGDTAHVIRGVGYDRMGTEQGLTTISFKVADVAGLHEMQQTSQPQLIPDVREVETWVYSRPEHAWIMSYVGVPIMAREQVIGFLNANSDTPGRFTETDAERLQTFADQVSIAVENARLYAQVQQELAERKRAEEELRQHRDRLEEVVAERTAELTTSNELLRQYAQDLEERNEELDAFAHTAAHDLKTPLGSIIGYAETMQMNWGRMDQEQLFELSETIARNGRRMNNIIDELLLLSSVREEEVEPEPLDMAQVVSDALERLAHEVEQRQAEIALPKRWPVASGYAPWITEVWLNYISNGLKYGGDPPCLELGAAKQGDGYVRFWVRDNGPGLTPEEQANLFTPFTRLDAVRAEGHGLGLSIVRRIMEKLGGAVGIESQGVPDQGSEFFFTLPSAQ